MRIVKGLSDKLLRETFNKQSFFIGRMPGTEARVLLQYIQKNENGIQQSIFDRLCQNTGFYCRPEEKITILKVWCELYLGALKNCDILFTLGYKRFNPLIEGFYPEIYEWSCVNLHQWIPLLQNKRVLVISPFTDTIQKQYKTKDFSKVFSSKIPSFSYPNFELLTVKSPNTIKGNDPFPHNNWLESFEELKLQIGNLEFDIAIVGCGGYGMPIANYIKQIGGSVIYAGSYTQIMFGIKGNRWKDQGWYNNEWVYPSEKETPKSYRQVEKGCYWKP